MKPNMRDGMPGADRRSLEGRTYSAGPFAVGDAEIDEFVGVIESCGVDGTFEPIGGLERAGSSAPPTFPIVFVMPALDAVLHDLGTSLAGVIHIDQMFSYQRAIVPGDRLEVYAVVVSARDIAGGLRMVIEYRLLGVAGDTVCRARSTLLVGQEETGVV